MLIHIYNICSIIFLLILYYSWSSSELTDKLIKIALLILILLGVLIELASWNILQINLF